MNSVVWKFPIAIGIGDEVQRLAVPAGAKFLTLQTQNNEPMMWWLVDPSTKRKDHYNIRVVGTGWAPAHQLSYEPYLGTFQIEESV